MKNMMRLQQVANGQAKKFEMEMPRQFSPSNQFPVYVEMFEQTEPKLEELFPSEIARNIILEQASYHKGKGEMVGAIKVIRAFTGWTLLTAKEFVENMK